MELYIDSTLLTHIAESGYEADLLRSIIEDNSPFVRQFIGDQDARGLTVYGSSSLQFDADGEVYKLRQADDPQQRMLKIFEISDSERVIAVTTVEHFAEEYGKFLGTEAGQSLFFMYHVRKYTGCLRDQCCEELLAKTVSVLSKAKAPELNPADGRYDRRCLKQALPVAFDVVNAQIAKDLTARLEAVERAVSAT